MLTFDQRQIDSAGSFLVGELERLDPTMNMPLASVTYTRDIDLREDVSPADIASSFLNVSFAAAGGPSTTGKNWIGKNSTSVPGVAVDLGKTTLPMTPWGMTVQWTVQELLAAQQVGRPIDTIKFDGMTLKHAMDTDEMVYIGDTALGVKGLLNSTAVTAEDPITYDTNKVTWAAKLTAGGPTAILDDVNKLLNACWAASGYAVCPDSLLLPPAQYSAINVPVTSAGSVSILKYIAENSIANGINGKPLRIEPVKWLYQRGASSKDRACAYTKDKSRVRFPMTPLQRLPLQYRDFHHVAPFWGTLGVVEFVYPETVRYMDGI